MSALVVMTGIAWVCCALAPESVEAQPGPGSSEVTLTSESLLTLTGSSVIFRLEGPLSSALPSAVLVVDVFGPGDPLLGIESLPWAGGARVEVGDLEGTVALDIPLEAEWLAEPGAYAVRVALESNGTDHLVVESRLGRVAADAPIVDLAFVVPIALGIWQEPGGTFVGGGIEQLASPVSGGIAALFSLTGLLEVVSGTHLTLAVEPVLLAQLEDAADGLMVRGPDGGTVEYGAQDPVALAAGSALQILRSVAQREGVQVVPLPYATPSLPSLAVAGWSDGVSQVRLGKAELSRIIGIPEAPRGALPSGLDLSTDSIASFSGASVDYVVTRAAVIDDLAEPPADPLGPVRISDTANNRLTVAAVSKTIATALAGGAQPADVCAAIAAVVAEGGHRSLVICPEDEYRGIDPERLSEIMAQVGASGAFRTLTLAELVESHPPDRRPVFLSRYAAHETGLIAETLAHEVEAAHALVADYMSAADGSAARAGTIAALLFRAESRHWLRADLSPEVAGLGIQYAQEAKQAAEQELRLVAIEDARVETDGAVAGSIVVRLRNSTVYSWRVILELRREQSGAGPLSSQVVTLEPGISTVALRATAPDQSSTPPLALDPGTYIVALRAGSSTLGSHTVRVTTSWLSRHWVWLVATGGVLVLVAVVSAALWRRRAARRRAVGGARRAVTRGR